MSAEEVAERTGLTVAAAALAKQREYDEPLAFEGSTELIEHLDGLIKARGLKLSRAGRFFHLSGATDKGTACRYLVETYRQAAEQKGDRTLAVGIGDSLNDLPMMALAGLSVGFDAKAPVRDLADVLLDARDLSMLLPLMGLS